MRAIKTIRIPLINYRVVVCFENACFRYPAAGIVRNSLSSGCRVTLFARTRRLLLRVFITDPAKARTMIDRLNRESEVWARLAKKSAFVEVPLAVLSALSAIGTRKVS